ncbi:MAG TPA: histidinol dehydrogenase [Bacteroidota bacterium]|nr:histidinol dehydrogenase [Bacteroidota bacterium]
MIRFIDARMQNAASIQLPPAVDDSRETTVDEAVQAILDRVKTEGDDALRFYNEKFGGGAKRELRVSAAEMNAAYARADKKFIAILKTAIRNIRAFHTEQMRPSWVMDDLNGSELRQLIRPIDRAGVYVPGGTAAYPSTVLMNVIPAQVAGVREIHLVSPPDAKGNVHQDVLTAAKLLGVKNVYRVGGAHAIAALAFGTETVPAVDKIVGPGNIYVATAKKLVYGRVGIDSFAGPSEVVILADATANPAFVATDLLAQAEHDELASCVLVTTSEALAHDVKEILESFVVELPRSVIMKKALSQRSAIYLMRTISDAIVLTNRLAPEHLEIITKNDEAVLKKIRHAGSIFLGNYSPVALGDYYAGPNHVLPTERTARFASPLSVDDFQKKSSVIRYTQARVRAAADTVAAFAVHEGLAAHALSVTIRKESKL